MTTLCALVGSAGFEVDHFLRLAAEDRFGFVLAVDGGYAHLRAAGVWPDLVIGDFDSLGYIPDTVPTKTFPVRKDATDIELALRYAADMGYKRLVVYGCLGGRIDLTLAVIQLLGQYARRGIEVFAVGEGTVATALAGSAELRFRANAAGTVSVFALSDEAFGVCEEGLSYTLSDTLLHNDAPLGVSNEFVGRSARIAVGEGLLLVIFPRDAWNALCF